MRINSMNMVLQINNLGSKNNRKKFASPMCV